MVGRMLNSVVCSRFKNSLNWIQMSQAVHLSLHPGRTPPNHLQVVASSSSSWTRMRYLSGEGQLDVGVRVVGSEERAPRHIQEMDPPSFLASPSCPGSFSSKAEINHLDGVGHRVVQFDRSLTAGSGSGPRYNWCARTSRGLE